ncbi:MAG: sensor histidine kinase [Marvinbryantia sp.]|jgi:signal transduction histidine kinase/uncharacterized protein YxeA
MAETKTNKLQNRIQNKRMTSIARRINMTFWLKRFSDIILLDLALLLLICGSFLIYCERNAARQAHTAAQLSERSSETIGQLNSEKEEQQTEQSYLQKKGEEETERFDAKTELTGGWFRLSDELGRRYWAHEEESYYYVIERGGGEYAYLLNEVLEIVVYAGMILLALQMVHLFLALFHTSEIRRMLKPLNDLAIKAEEISTISFDPGKFASLEHAIENISPDGPEANIHTGDQDLQSIEVALNNLLHHMKESQRQQARFVSDASHELRTPIAVIQGYVNMLDRWGKEDESVLEESIEALKNESQHMKDLVEQLLFLARGDSGRNTLHKVVFDLTETMREVWEESMMIDRKHCYTFAGPEGAFIYGDLAMVKQSIRIFVQNAAKYSDEGDEIHLEVQTDRSSVSYVVQDEGIGMQDTEVVHIFERFYRSDEARNGETGGSGLGLSIAKWIIDEHDGVINVLSRPEFGTRFTVRFKSSNNS